MASCAATMPPVSEPLPVAWNDHVVAFEAIAVMIGRGEALSNSWCEDDTVSILLEA